MKTTVDRIRQAIALPLAAGAVPALCAPATVLVPADAQAQISYWLESATDDRARSYPLEIVAEATRDAAESRRLVLISLFP